MNDLSCAPSNITFVWKSEFCLIGLPQESVEFGMVKQFLVGVTNMSGSSWVWSRHLVSCYSLV